MRLPLRVGAAAAALAAVLALTGCGDPSIAEEGTPSEKVEPLELTSLPPTILDLAVKPEDSKETLTRTKDRTYFDKVSLYSLRQVAGPQKDLVQATLQVGLFNKDARPDDPDFRAAILTQLGGSTPQRLQLGEDEVHITKGQQQSVAVWFRGDYVFILSTRQDFDRPRALVRAMLQVQV